MAPYVFDPNSISKSFCALPWSQLAITNFGHIKPCCIFNGTLLKDDSTPFNISKDSLEDIWNSPHLREIRTKMLQGQPVPECIKCTTEEKSFNSSERYNRCYFPTKNEMDRIDEAKQKDGFITNYPTMLDLKVGNKCNLKCRMCQPADSCAIDSEFFEISKIDPDFRSYDNSNAFDYHSCEMPFYQTSCWANSERAQKNLELVIPSLQHVCLAGGETTLTNEIILFLEKCAELGYSSQISLSMSSNLSYLPEKFLNLIKKFKHSQVNASIDGIGKVQEYIRFPSKWDVVYNNFETLVNYAPNITPVIFPTVQIYNLLNIDEVLKLPEQFLSPKWESLPSLYLTVLLHPSFLNIRHLPDDIKEMAYKNIKCFQDSSIYCAKSKLFNDQINLLLSILSSKEFKYNPSEIAHFLKYTEVLDRHRNQSLADSIPELHNALSKLNLTAKFPGQGNNSYTFYTFKNKGLEFFASKSFSQAQEMLEQAFVLDNNDHDILLHLGEIYFLIDKDYNNALKYFLMAHEVNPNNEFIKQRIKECQAGGNQK